MDDDSDNQGQDETEMEIARQALHLLDEPASAATLSARRTSLDRSYTMPPPSWEEGDQILKEYRLRKAAREAARSNRTSEGGVWDTPPRTQLQASAPPTVLQASDPDRSPSRTTISSTLSFREKTNSGEALSPTHSPGNDIAQAGSTPLPASATESSTSSNIFKLSSLPRLGSFRKSSSGHGADHCKTVSAADSSDSSSAISVPITRRRPSSTRAMSDGPLATRRVSSNSSRDGAVAQATPSRTSSARSAKYLGTAGDYDKSRQSSLRSMHRSMPPSIRTEDHPETPGEDIDVRSPPTSPASIIDHGEAAVNEASSMAEATDDGRSPRSLADELRGHSIPMYDDSAYGIPKTVIIGGQRIDISEMGILEQVEMLRQAQQETKNGKIKSASGSISGIPPLESLDLYQSMPSTDLSVIAEQTECSTYSRRSTIAPTNRSESLRSQPIPVFGRQLAPTHTRSRLSISTAHSSLSGLSKATDEDSAALTQAERIKNRYMRKAASEQDATAVAQAKTPRSGTSSPSRPPSHRKYTSIGETNYHTFPQSPTQSLIGEGRKLPSSLSNMELSAKAPKQPGSGNVLLPSAMKTSRGAPSPRGDSLFSAHSGDMPFVPSNVSSSAASGRYSPSKLIVSPAISQKVEQFITAPSLPEDDYNVSPLYRKRSKSMHSDDRSALSRVYIGASQSAISRPLPTVSGLPPSKSTSALVQMFESKSSTGQAERSSSPVKEWLKKVDNRPPPSPGVYPPSALSVSSASGSMADYNAFSRRKAKYEQSGAAPSTIASTVPSNFEQRRKRSQSLTALPEVLITQEADQSTVPRTASASSFDDSEVIYHSDLYWLNSSSSVRPPFWQACRAVLTAKDELRISWLGTRSGITHERFFELSSCSAAHSIRRAPTVTTATVQAYDPEATPVNTQELSKLQVFELTWPGRAHRFACPSLASRVKWLGHIFEVLVKYSNPNTPLTEKEDAPAEERSLGSATMRSLDLPSPGQTIQSSQAASIVSGNEEMPRRQLEKETQDSLYASVSEMLTSKPGSGRSSRKVSDLPDIPRHQLRDFASPKLSGFETPLSPVSVAPKALRGAWSDADRASTQSEIVSAPAAKTVARDLKRILTMMGKTRSSTGLSTVGQGFPDQMKEMQTHLERISNDIRSTSVASRHSRHAPEMVSKMDELLTLCKKIAEEHTRASGPDQGQPAASMVRSGSAGHKAGLVDEKDKHPGLERLEEKVETLLEVVNRLAAAESPTERKRSRSPERSRQEPRSSTYTGASASTAQGPATLAPAAHIATAQAFAMLPTTPELMSQMEADFDKDVAQWQKYDKKRNSALPPLPSTGPPPSKKVEPNSMQALKEQADLTDFYNSLSRKPVESSVRDSFSRHQDSMRLSASEQSRPSSIVSSNRVRNARSDAAMRLEGSHPALLATKEAAVPRPLPMKRQAPMSKWSPDTAPLDQASRMPSLQTKRTVVVEERPARLDLAASPQVDRIDEDSSPPTPRQQDYPRSRVVATDLLNAAPSPALADKKTQDAMLLQLNSMEGLLKTLVAGQSKQTEAFKHQEDVSVYIKHLQEYLAEDRTQRKEEFATIKESLSSISQQLSGLPKEIQTVIEASLAVATLQAVATEPAAKDPMPAPAPAPDSDSPGPDLEPATAPPKAADAALPSKAPATGQRSQGKKTGTSLLRKVSLGLAGMAGAGAAHPGIKVGGPRKMGATRLFGHPPAGGVAPDGRDRWKADRYKAGDVPSSDAPRPDAMNDQAAPAPDPQAPLMEALEGFEKELSDNGEENDDRQTVIALGILEVLKMLKEQESREHEREHYRREDQVLKMDLERERHAAEIEAVRLELRQWEAKREELAAQQHKDPENEEGIDTIIALLKDQMAHQELALVNLKDTLTPKIRDIGLESEEAILAMREEMSKNLASFKSQLDDEVKRTLDEVGALRDQKKQLQSDLSDLLAFKSKYGGGAPETVQQKAAPAAGPYAQPGQFARPIPRQGQPHAYLPPRPDTSMSSGVPSWGLRGPR